LIIGEFTDVKTGNIILSVTDVNVIQASVNLSLKPGDFPYNFGYPETEAPEGTVLDLISGLLWADNYVRNRLSWDDAEAYCADEVRLGGFTDWRLPNLAELTDVYSRKDIFTYYSRAEYWSSDVEGRQDEKARTRDFGNGREKVRQKRDQKDVFCVRNR